MNGKAALIFLPWRPRRCDGSWLTGRGRSLAEKHGGGEEKIQLEEALVFSPQKSKDLVALDDALKVLEELSPRQARVVELRFFAGMEIEEIAKLEGVSVRTIKQDWSLARAWLHHEIAKGE